MRISTRVSLSLSALALVVFGGAGTFQVLREKRDLERGLIRDAATLGQATAESLRQDLIRHSPEDSAALLRSFPRYDEDLEVTVSRPGSTGPASRPESASRAAFVERVAAEAVESGRVAHAIISIPSEGRTAIVAAPIDTRQDAGAVVLVQSLDEVDADVEAEAAMTAVAVGLFSLLAGLAGLMLGQVYIVRPLARLDQAMSVVARGDLSAAPLGGSRDEVGRVLNQFDEMRGELARARDRLEAERDAHRTTLERLADADRLVTVGQLAAGLAHEIGSPLQVLGGRARKLVARAEPGGDTARTAAIIVAQTERITGIVRQLLQFARPQISTPRTVDPLVCIAPVVELLELEAARQGVSVRLAPEGNAKDSAAVLIDADALQQVVFNLARNALAAVNDGGVVDIRVGVEAAQGGEQQTLQLVVADDGVGIADGVREKLFEPFFTTRGDEGGIGLGLAVVRALVERMDGTITCSSRDEGGTAFVVRLRC